MLLISLACLANGYCRAQSLRYPLAATYTGLGAYSKRFADAFAGTANQAALPELPAFSAGIYGENRFLIPELNRLFLAIAIPGKPGALGIHARYSGTPEYHESQIGLAYAKNLGKVNIGAQFNYHQYNVAGSGNQGVLSVEIGTLWHISEHIHTGFHIFNPSGGRFGRDKEEKLAAIYKAGFGFEASEKVYLAMEISKEEGRGLNVISGLQYVFAEKFFGRMGISTATAQPFIGAGWKWNKLRLDITGSYHFSLGWSPGILFIYQAPAGLQSPANPRQP